ncbi:3-isopropylmalate dehydratase small subunit [Mycobacterium montefiorense]|uniref:3-isopropylmalate dehydratase small subunit n=1 Tax=Mycobacterium montefiorense TaxID=154654 RepID=A0AA37PIN9_9MYCO|nr:3-isopropylmalate dehydratase small subunit [Mycobacterium montefiorense]GBG38350.1 3-isopropylmalate dehydratase small subunit [Mycobacterium montefiorense]GKU34179.1 3-isopropylmalate dehydratase small subunit [Mycobacterium montefiorense]GKU38797.1 3-isopropylmalate dehydratase small subunit [Mycobacterium montefiorense]GKU48166.1 3-isopropylmalate dehydratase small subunit [Mycobacterium montefiorense]GKU49561.1 3-isopropylmalate dehydratase small subunit [Mycobacterium montefiorense]
MEPFQQVTGIAAPMLRANVDTDALSPSRFKPSELAKHGSFKEALFLDWRSDEQGCPRTDFVLNQKPYDRATILVAGQNFGCGSSRESAVWALRDNGFRAVIAPSFATIFQNNCIGNGLLPLPLPAGDHQRLVAETFGSQTSLTVPRIEIDLLACEVGAVAGPRHRFTLDKRARNQLLNGLDAIGNTLQLRDQIERFRTRDYRNRPWIYHRPETVVPS